VARRRRSCGDGDLLEVAVGGDGEALVDGVEGFDRLGTADPDLSHGVRNVSGRVT